MITTTELAAELGLECQSTAPTRTIHNVSSPRTAGPYDLVFAEDADSLQIARLSPAAAVIATVALAASCPEEVRILLSSNPRLDFAKASRLLRMREQFKQGVHPAAIVSAEARVHENVAIGAGAIVEARAEIGEGTAIGAGVVVSAGVQLGAGCRIYAGVVIYSGVTLGQRVIVHAGAVLGADGFGYVRDPATGEYLSFPQQGTLVIEDDVEIGANATIDRGALEETRIGRGTKIDNLVHIGHNARIGRQIVIAAQTGISGSSVVGDGAVIGGQVGIADHVQIGAGVILGAQAGIPSQKRLRGSGVVFWGTPARPIREYLKELAALARLVKQGRSGSKATSEEN